MNNVNPTTTPKPFVFVLMPFDQSFADIYKFGIKGAAEEVGAYAERLDEQLFVEGMLDRIFNQISRADVIVADMTGRNPNVFYEVGYAHALGKITLLLTQNAADIPFDLKHRQHTVYGGSIDVLRKELADRLRWAIAEARRQVQGPSTERMSIGIFETEVPRTGAVKDLPVVSGTVSARSFALPLQIRNDSFEPLAGITHIYLFAEETAGVVPCRFVSSPDIFYPSYRFGEGKKTIISAIGGFETFGLETAKQVPEPLESLKPNPLDCPDGMTKQFRLPITLSALPPGAVETTKIDFVFRDKVETSDSSYRLRVHTPSRFHDHSFRLRIQYQKPKSDGAATSPAEEGPK